MKVRKQAKQKCIIPIAIMLFLQIILNVSVYLLLSQTTKKDAGWKLILLAILINGLHIFLTIADPGSRGSCNVKDSPNKSHQCLEEQLTVENISRKVTQNEMHSNQFSEQKQYHELTDSIKVKKDEKDQILKDSDFSYPRNCQHCQKIHLEQTTQTISCPQVLRQKHCHECQTCIFTMDHHCPYVNNCIGQFTRPYFYLYIMFLFCQTSYGLAILIYQQFFVSQINDLSTFAFSMVLIIWGALLLLYPSHNYLMIANVTTWQYLRKNEIWYLKNSDRSFLLRRDLSEQENRKLKNPFDFGLTRNLIMYWSNICRFWMRERVDWDDYFLFDKERLS